MYNISQNSAIDSLNRALVPGKEMIDGRTETDRLWFITEFAGLINFYNSDNKLQGNWKPFLLKDPVFLLACISKTSFTYFFSRYQSTCAGIELLLQTGSFAGQDIRDAYKLLNQLFGRLKNVYEQVGCWVYYMQLSSENYDLNTYVTGLVKSTFSPYFWSLKAMHACLFSLLDESIRSEKKVLAEAEYFNNDLWLMHKGSQPWWEILGLDSKPSSLRPVDDHNTDSSNYQLCFATLKKTGDVLFHLFKNIISYSYKDYEKLAAKKSKYPDTTLLRTLVRLLGIHQEQLNGIAQKHLDFFYRDILKQRKQQDESSCIYLSAHPTTGSVIKLPAGTAFHVATNNNKRQIFCTLNEESLHPAILAGATTLSYVSSGDTVELFQDTVTNLSTTQFMEDGLVKSWKTFGGRSPGAKKAAAMGVAFASPMLYLKDGIRTITFTFTFSSPQADDLFSNAAFFLSTQKKWLQVPPGPGVTVKYIEAGKNAPSPVLYSGASIIIQLGPEQPVIENFTVNPDGIRSQWPMFKILFEHLTNNPPQSFIQTLDISVTVKGLRSFELYNDSGAISVKSPYAPFSTIPTFGSSCIIGSNEVFSKPVSAFSIAIDWSNLPKLPATADIPPDDFETYYKGYNNCEPVAATPGKKTTAVSVSLAPATDSIGIVKKIQQIFNLFKSKLARVPSAIYKKIKTFFSNQPGPPPDLFNNGSFTVGFQVLENASWVPALIQPPENYAMQLADDPRTTVVISPIDTCLPYGVQNSLFRVNKNNLLVDGSCFELTAPSLFTKGYSPDPAIQNSTLSFTDKTVSGFIKMELTGPAQGFGSALYPKVVANIALQNAITITDWFRFSFCKPNILPPANLPFVPMAGNLAGTYTASVTYDLATPDGNYPLQCFSYSAFANYEVYNNTPGSPITPGNITTTIAGPASQPFSGVPFFPAFNGEGALLLQFSELLPGNIISLYFELVRKNIQPNSNAEVHFSYLSQLGWKKLELLCDSTSNFACSGIIKLNIPADITNSSVAMPGKNYWIALSAQGTPEAFSQTVCLSVNGFAIQQDDDSLFKDAENIQVKKTSTGAATVIPVAPLAAKLKPLTAPNLAIAGNDDTMNQRISARIKTKDRIITPYDFYMAVRRRFNYIFYSKVSFATSPGPVGGRGQRILQIHLVKKSPAYSQPDALLPFVTVIEEKEIKHYLEERMLPSVNLQVSNFEPQFVRISVWVTLENNFENEEGAIRLLVNKALNIYLSPWLNADQKQLSIEAPLTDAGVADCLTGIKGVSAVSEVKFTTWLNSDEFVPDNFFDTETNGSVKPISAAHLFVSSLHHLIYFNKAA